MLLTNFILPSNWSIVDSSVKNIIKAGILFRHIREDTVGFILKWILPKPNSMNFRKNTFFWCITRMCKVDSVLNGSSIWLKEIAMPEGLFTLVFPFAWYGPTLSVLAYIV